VTELAQVREILGLDGDVDSLIAEVERRLAQGDDDAWRRASEEHAQALERLRGRYESRSAALARVQQGIAALREVTAPRSILERAPESLCRSSDFDRAVLSLVREGRLVAEAAHFRDDAAGAEHALSELVADPPRLEHPLIEIDVLRRRRATIVTDAHEHAGVHRPTARVMGWSSYVAAPIVVRGDVIGAIHADARERGPEVLDRDVLWAFATGLSEVYETASLRRALRHQRAEMQQFVEWLGARSIELDDASMTLAHEQPGPPVPPGVPDAIAAAPGVDDRLVFDGLLTRRELDVLRLLARGETNAAIAGELVVSETTVKFHVVNILRKLHVHNRAEAVSRYHRLMQKPRL
jgi:LuxR family transcriptional regulator, regulator of acetate metabolism